MQIKQSLALCLSSLIIFTPHTANADLRNLQKNVDREEEKRLDYINACVNTFQNAEFTTKNPDGRYAIKKETKKIVFLWTTNVRDNPAVLSSYPFSRRVLDPPYGCYHKTNLLPYIRDGIYLDKVIENSRGEKWQISIEGNNLVVYGSANKNNLKRWIIGCKINDYEFLSKAIQGVCREESRDWNHTSLNNFPN